MATEKSVAIAFWNSFAATSGIKGLNYLASAKSVFERFIWVLALIAASIMTVRDITHSISTYNSGATVTNLKVNSQLPAYVDDMKICLYYSATAIKTDLSYSTEVAAYLGNTSSYFDTTKLVPLNRTSDLFNSTNTDSFPLKLLLLLVNFISRFEARPHDKLKFLTAQRASQLLFKLIPGVADNFAANIRQIAVDLWSAMKLNVSREFCFDDCFIEFIDHKQPQYMTWAGTMLGAKNYYQLCYQTDSRFLQFYDSSTKITVSFDHSTVFTDAIPFAAVMIGSTSPYAAWTAENVFYPQIDKRVYLNLRQLGRYKVMNSEKVNCLEAKLSITECKLTCLSVFLYSIYNCSPIFTTFTKSTINTPLCNYDNQEHIWNTIEHNNTIRSCNEQCKQRCDRTTYYFDMAVDVVVASPNATILVINLVSYVHPTFEEQLAMDLQMLFGRLGGNLCLWLGASFLVLLHTVISLSKLPFLYWKNHAAKVARLQNRKHNVKNAVVFVTAVY